MIAFPRGIVWDVLNHAGVEAAWWSPLSSEASDVEQFEEWLGAVGRERVDGFPPDVVERLAVAANPERRVNVFSAIGTGDPVVSAFVAAAQAVVVVGADEQRIALGPKHVPGDLADQLVERWMSEVETVPVSGVPVVSAETVAVTNSLLAFGSQTRAELQGVLREAAVLSVEHDPVDTPLVNSWIDDALSDGWVDDGELLKLSEKFEQSELARALSGALIIRTEEFDDHVRLGVDHLAVLATTPTTVLRFGEQVTYEPYTAEELKAAVELMFSPPLLPSTIPHTGDSRLSSNPAVAVDRPVAINRFALAALAGGADELLDGKSLFEPSTVVELTVSQELGTTSTYLNRSGDVLSIWKKSATGVVAASVSADDETIKERVLESVLGVVGESKELFEDFDLSEDELKSDPINWTGLARFAVSAGSSTVRRFGFSSLNAADTGELVGESLFGVTIEGGGTWLIEENEDGSGRAVSTTANEIAFELFASQM